MKTGLVAVPVIQAHLTDEEDIPHDEKSTIDRLKQAPQHPDIISRLYEDIFTLEKDMIDAISQTRLTLYFKMSTDLWHMSHIASNRRR